MQQGSQTFRLFIIHGDEGKGDFENLLWQVLGNI